MLSEIVSIAWLLELECPECPSSSDSLQALGVLDVERMAETRGSKTADQESQMVSHVLFTMKGSISYNNNA